jgi:hypothetical protein
MLLQQLPVNLEIEAAIRLAQHAFIQLDAHLFHPYPVVALGASSTGAASLKLVAQLEGGLIQGGETISRSAKATRRSHNLQVVKETFRPQYHKAKATPWEAEDTKGHSTTLPQLT